MTGQILNFDDPVHREMEVLLPWFVNGTLKADELMSVELHLKECVRCQREVNWLREMRMAYVGSETVPDATSSFHKLRPRLDNPPTRLSRLREFWRQTQIGLRWTLAVQLAIILVLGSFLVSSSEPTRLYRTLGITEGGRQATGDLVVVFDPRITEAELRRILLQIGARIVNGPTNTDAYVLELSGKRPAAALEMLRAEPAVKLAKRLDSGTAR